LSSPRPCPSTSWSSTSVTRSSAACPDSEGHRASGAEHLRPAIWPGDQILIELVGRLGHHLGRMAKAAARDRAPDERVLHAAARLFREQGYAATSLRDIARAAGMLPGSLHYRYPSKEDILSALMERAI